MRIVVVDDEPDARELARMVLERGGHEVHTARHPDEALQVLAQHSVDVVLTDLHMPRMDGQELAACIAELHPEVACIVWSTIAGEDGGDIRRKDVMRLRIEEWIGEDDAPIREDDVVVSGDDTLVREAGATEGDEA